MKFCSVIFSVILSAFLISRLSAATPTQTQASSTALALATDGQPIGLDDFHYSSRLHRLLVPAGRTGKLIFLDPANNSMTEMSGFGTTVPEGSRGAGITSVDEAGELLVATDRSNHQLDVVDPATKKIIASSPLAAGPDYVRYVSTTNEVWITEPHTEQIEIFSYPAHPGTAPAHLAAIDVKGGPEALVIDQARGRAYTNIDDGKTQVIDLKSRKIVETWPNGCEGAEGALKDDTGKYLFVACHEGKVVTLDLANHGKIVSSVASGKGVDIIDYNPSLHHLYVPGAESATLTIVAVSGKGELSAVRTVPSVEGGHCVTAAPNGNVYVCDPHHGGLLVIHDQN